MLNPRTSLISRYIVDDLSWENMVFYFQSLQKNCKNLNRQWSIKARWAFSCHIIYTIFFLHNLCINRKNVVKRVFIPRVMIVLAALVQ
jgi:hypothetical protein